MIYFNKKAEKKKQQIWKSYLLNKDDKDYLSIYIHIPFCTQKCNYCEYSSHLASCISDEYLDYLEDQFKETAPFFKDEKIKSVMFGGGTPNILSPRQLKKVLDMVQYYWDLEISDNNEMGFECNPYHLSDEHIDVLRNSFINRLSMGVQSFDKQVIKNENRLYTSVEKIKHIYDKTRDFIKIINVDLLAGLIRQTPEILVNDVGELLNIGIESITIYELNRVINHNGLRMNKESSHKEKNRMLLEVYKKYGNFPNYYYIGTTHEQFQHCNKFYKKVEAFEYFYNPGPAGYNNVLAFSIDERKKTPYSHFTCVNQTYQKLNKNATIFSSFQFRIFQHHWLDAFKQRK